MNQPQGLSMVEAAVVEALDHLRYFVYALGCEVEGSDAQIATILFLLPDITNKLMSASRAAAKEWITDERLRTIS